MNHETLCGWVNAAKRAERSTAGRHSGEQVSASEREELRRLRRKVAELEAELLDAPLASVAITGGASEALGQVAGTMGRRALTLLGVTSAPAVVSISRCK